jgi:hypothetical protein
MKGLLTKRGDNYVLFVGDAPFASTMKDPYKNLSIKNCNEIFSIVNVNELAEEWVFEINGHKWSNNDNSVGDNYGSYKEGFNKAMELNKDKLFTLEDLKKAIEFDQYEFAYGEIECRKNENQINEFIQSFQHPTQIEVEITCMKDCQSNPQCDEFENNCIHCTNTGIPLLNSDGNLILKKI